MDSLKKNLFWEQEQIFIFGKETLCPRLTAWYGDEGINYNYSGVLHQAKGWHPALLALSQKLQQDTGCVFNSVLCNYYRNGQDSIGWHSDAEPELAPNPSIASISLGATRRFIFRHKVTKQQIDVELEHGSLLLMLNETQHFWQHTLPKTKKTCGERINLTFRLVHNR